MSRQKIGVLVTVMLLAFSVDVVGAVDAESLLPQVVYQFEIYELENLEEQELVLEAITIRKDQSREFGFSFSLDGAFDLFGPAPTQFTALNSIQKNFRMATPGIVAVLGRTSTLRVVEERLISERYSEATPFQLSGMEISVGPVQVTRAGSIFSVFDIKTFDSDNTLHSEVWIRAGEQVPLATIEVEERRFAVFVAASLVDKLDSPSRSVAGLGGLSDLWWKSPPVLHWEGALWVVLPFGPIDWPEGGFSVRLDPKFYVDGEHQRTTSYSYLGFGASVLDGGPCLDVRWIHTQKGHSLAAGVTDRVTVHPGLTLSAGFLPVVFNLSDRDFHKPHWWVELEAEGESVHASVRFQYAGEGNSILRTKLGYKFAEHKEVFAQLTHARGSTRFGLGLNLMF